MANNNLALPEGIVLHGEAYDYKITSVLGQGSFGITYRAKVEMRGALGTLDSNMYVAIKEFFMKEVNGRDNTSVTSGSTSRDGLFEYYREKFEREARNLSSIKILCACWSRFKLMARYIMPWSISLDKVLTASSSRHHTIALMLLRPWATLSS